MTGARSQKLTFILPRKFYFSTSTMRGLALILSHFSTGYELSELKQDGSPIAARGTDGMWKLELKLSLRKRKRSRRNSRLVRTRKGKR
jgi:hypothetical protein